MHGYPRGSGPGPRPDHQEKHSCGSHRRNSCPRSGRYRPDGRHAGHGGQSPPVQGVRRSGRVPGVPRRVGPAGDHRHGHSYRADVRWHQPGGHRRTGRLRGGGSPAQGPGYPRLPRRPARNGSGDTGRALERLSPHRASDQRPLGGYCRNGGSWGGRGQDPAQRRSPEDRRCGPIGSRLLRSGQPEPGQGVVRHQHQPGPPDGNPAGSNGRCRRVHRP